MFEPGGFLNLYAQGIPLVFQFNVIIALIIGTTIGIIFGVIPGLSATIGVAIFTPLTFTMSTSVAFAVLLGIYCGSVYGGSISAILVNIPGTAASVMTKLDGHPLAQKGEAGRAIGLATTSSFIGGVISVFLLAFFAPKLANFALRLSAQEYFAICLFGISIIAYISDGSPIKGLISGIIGLLLATVGTDPITAYTRFTFNKAEIVGGFEVIPLMVGLFGISEVLKMVENKDIAQPKAKIFDRARMNSFKEVFKYFGTVIRGSAIGTFIGAVPATGGTIASIISYGVEKRLSKHPETFGKGEPRGIIGPESANNAATGGAMIPMLTLGIPGDVVTAILIGALMLHGLAPGPLLFEQNPEIVSSIFILLFLSNILFLILGLFGAKYFAKVVSWPKPILVSMILCLAIVGTFSVRNSIFDIWVLVIAGFAGYMMNKFGIPTAPLILGFILGGMVEQYLRQSLVLSYGNIFSFFSRPISSVALILTILTIFSPYITKLIKIFSINKKV
jgi:putative tricarboxylic transport membrane protein